MAGNNTKLDDQERGIDMGGVGEGMNMLKTSCMEFSKKNSNENTQIHMWFSFLGLLVFFFF